MKRVLAAAASCCLLLSAPAAAQQPSMTAHFIDVGQAHATLLEFACGAMLVDAGADEQHDGTLVAYLGAFFRRRKDLDSTLGVVLITHNHKDHTQSLRAVIDAGFRIVHYIDNGFTQGSGVANPNWLKAEARAGRLPIAVREITERAVEAAPGHTGLRDTDIDPFECDSVNPQIRILTGSRRDDNPGWPEGDFDNQNNHSLVTRVDFGKASFLFMGDLEERGIESLLDFYGDAFTGVLNTDVLQVGHHGSNNATSAELLKAVTPNVAVIPMGAWTFGQGSGSRFTTFAYGHPRQSTVTLLAASIARKRPQPRTVMLGVRGFHFEQGIVRRAIYATGWDGNVRVVATPQGTFTVYREH